MLTKISTARRTNSKGVITDTLVKDSSGTLVAESDLVPNGLSGVKEIALTINLDDNLTSGTCTLFLYTNDGGPWASPRALW